MLAQFSRDFHESWMFVSASEMYHLEEELFASGTSAENLMDEVGLKIAHELRRRFPDSSNLLAIAVIGKGNNAADALVALHHLREAGWRVALRASIPPSKLSGLALKKYQQLGEIMILDSLLELETPHHLILLDGLLGIGSMGEIREPQATLAREMNHLRQLGRATTFAIDLPSGLDCHSGGATSETVVADLTLTLGRAKQGLIADQAIDFVGSLELIAFSDLATSNDHADYLITPQSLPTARLTPPFHYHKGEAGRIGIIAGSKGLAGAAALSALGALRAGGGLITVFVREEDYPFILPLVPVEVMVKPVKSYREVLEHQLDCLALGPGLGLQANHEVLFLINHFAQPAVIDADALNLLSQRGSLSKIPSHHVLTPHPGEMKRLLPDAQGSRAEIAREFTTRCRATLLYKGARTIITQRQSPLSYNTSGTPAMASGGQGDLLTGVISAFLARGFTGMEAAQLASWLTGRASEIAALDHSIEWVSATTTAAYLGKAFRDLRLRASL